LFISLAVVLLTVYGIGWLAFCDRQTRETRLLALARGLSDNWKIGLLLILVLFYRTIRTFLEQAEEAWGVKRRRLAGEQLNPSSLEFPQEHR
jgi:hypothetical protein